MDENEVNRIAQEVLQKVFGLMENEVTETVPAETEAMRWRTRYLRTEPVLYALCEACRQLEQFYLREEWEEWYFEEGGGI